MWRNGTDNKGFSLLEILVALALMGTLMVSATQVTVRTRRSIAMQDSRIRLVLTARSVASWWQRLSDSRKTNYLSREYQPLSEDIGPDLPGNMSWRILPSENSSLDVPTFIEVRNDRSQTIRIPLFHRREL